MEGQAKSGHDGLCTRPNHATDEPYAAFYQHGIDISATYVVLPANGANLPDAVVKHIESLKGRNTIVWLALTNAEASHDRAVATIRKVYDLAKANGLGVVLYPHVGSRTDTLERCEHLRKVANRPGLGVSLTFCHFLVQNDDEKLEKTTRSVAPRLKLVQISGANRIPPGKPDRKELIKSLGTGNFDTGRVLRTLDEIGYEGPANLQCYTINQPARGHLNASMRAWREYHE